MAFWDLPIGAQQDPLSRDELGRPLLRDYAGNRYTQSAGRPARGLLDYLNWQEQHRVTGDPQAASLGAAARGLLSGAWEGVSAPAKAARGEPVTYGDAITTALDAATGGAAAAVPDGALAANSFRAYHGSPHAFDRFSLDAIGTGEGAQAFGHGLYFADNEDIARSYRDTLSRRNIATTFDGRPLEASRDWWAAVDALNAGGDWRVGKLLDEFGRRGGEMDDYLREQRQWYASDPAMMQAIDDFTSRTRSEWTGGHLYEVQINADPASLLDWDAPLSQQAPNVREALNTLGYQPPAPPEFSPWTGETYTSGFSVRQPDGTVTRLGQVEDMGRGQWRAQFQRQDLGTFSSRENAQAAVRQAYGRTAPYEPSGRHAYSAISNGRPDGIASINTAAGSRALLDQGVLGLRYNDAGSRGADAFGATRNTVVFDDQIIEILRRYGWAGAIPAAPATLQGLLAQPLAAEDRDALTSYLGGI